MNFWLAVIVAILLSACAGKPTAPNCDPRSTWELGLSGQASPEQCMDRQDRIWLETYNLGVRWREFSTELEQIEVEIETLRRQGDEESLAASRRLNLRRITLVREMDNIRGVAQLRDLPLPE